MPSESKSTQTSIAGSLLLPIALLWCIYWFVQARGYWEDDAYIHLEFARSVAAGKGFAFNGHIVAGDTAPLWVLLLAAMHAVIPDWLTAGKVLAVFGAFFGLAGTFAFARSLSASLLPPSVGKVFPAAIILLIVANPYSCYWLFSGMEPIAAAGLACFAVLAATRDRPTIPTFLTGCLLAGLAPLLRPEMLFLTLLLALPLLGQWRRLPASTLKPKPAAFFAGLILIAAPLTLWSLYSLHAFGHLLPNTNAAKRAAPGDSVILRLLSVYSLGLPLILFGFFAGIAYLVLRPSAVRSSIERAIYSAFRRLPPTAPQTSSLPLAGWIFILWPLIATLFYIANHTYVQTRYILVTAPGLTVVIMALAFRSAQSAGRALYIIALIPALAVSIVIVRPFIRNKAIACQQISGLALFIRNQIPPSAPIADYSIGQIAFDSEHPIVDTGGITRPGAIPYLNAPPQAMLRWAHSQGAQYTIGDPPQPKAVPIYSLNQPFIGWTLHTALYATTQPVGLWKLELPPEPAPANGSATSRP